MSIYTPHLTDHDLVAAAYISRVRDYLERGERTYRVTFASALDSQVVVFAVASAGHARIYAAEYAARILGGSWHVVDVRWDRDAR